MIDCKVEITDEYICIRDTSGEEIVYWDKDEWHEDIHLVPQMVNAVKVACTEGSEAVRALLRR